ncbi:hypothetical protein Ahy_A01g003626 isoform D [Arachis hypogaea]|uniref:Uncharacterized protein n=1 Tax=Arachis hypogaea TaxID=3818 RepID=A0A445ETT2_ARAHY|nr:hypothetical protein Ahy_A01g003626 isoform D [Arachis hypogaea]
MASSSLSCYRFQDLRFSCHANTDQIVFLVVILDAKGLSLEKSIFLFMLLHKISNAFHLELVWHQIPWLCVEEQNSLLWKIFAIINGLCLGWIRLKPPSGSAVPIAEYIPGQESGVRRNLILQL